MEPKQLESLHEKCDQRVDQLTREYSDAKRSAATLKIIQAVATALGTLLTALLAARTARIIVAILTCASTIVASFGGLLPDASELRELRSLAIRHQLYGDSVRLQLGSPPDPADRFQPRQWGRNWQRNVTEPACSFAPSSRPACAWARRRSCARTRRRK